MRKASQRPMAAESMYWLPPSEVKQSGKAATTGPIRPSSTRRSRRWGTDSPNTFQFRWASPLPVKPTRSTNSG